MNGLLPPEYQMYMRLLSNMSGQNAAAPPTVGNMPQQQMLDMLMRSLFGPQMQQGNINYGPNQNY